MCSGHLSFLPRPAIMGSTNVFVNGRPAVRVGDMWAVHFDLMGMLPPHPGVALMGSTRLLINSRPAVRMGDMINCMSIAMMASMDVFDAG